MSTLAGIAVLSLIIWAVPPQGRWAMLGIMCFAALVILAI